MSDWSEAMRIEVQEMDGDVRRVVLDGALDIQGAARIEVPLAAVAGASTKVVVDLGAVGFLASIGIRALIVNAKTVQRRGGTMVLLNPQPNVAAVLITSGIDRVMPIHADLDAALAEFAPG
jgi:anti-sigma B factor antagonist